MKGCRTFIKYINDHLREDVEGIIVYIYVDDKGEVIDIIDIRMMVKDVLLPSDYEAKIKVTREELNSIKEKLKEGYLFSEKQYAQVLLLEITKK